MLIRIAIFLLLFQCQNAWTNAGVSYSQDPSRRYISNRSVGEIPEVKQLFSSLLPLLEHALDDFGKMPETNAEQYLFAKNELGKFQAWVNVNFSELLNMKKFLPLPDPAFLRYGRNLVLVDSQKGIYVFLHLLNPHCSTPKHWHSQKGMNSLAFATTLASGGLETKWNHENNSIDPDSGEARVQLVDECTHPLVVGQLVPIPGDYGSHQIANTSEEPLILFEIYFEPEKMDHIDIPILVMGAKVDHIIDTVPVSWLNENNLLITATREAWPSIHHINAARLILNDPNAKAFTIVEGETIFVPKSLLKKGIDSFEQILQGPDNRFLLHIKNT